MISQVYNYTDDQLRELMTKVQREGLAIFTEQWCGRDTLGGAAAFQSGLCLYQSDRCFIWYSPGGHETEKRCDLWRRRQFSGDLFLLCFY